MCAVAVVVGWGAAAVAAAAAAMRPPPAIVSAPRASTKARNGSEKEAGGGDRGRLRVLQKEELAMTGAELGGGAGKGERGRLRRKVLAVKKGDAGKETRTGRSGGGS